MMWLLTVLQALSAVQVVNLLTAGLYLALAAGLNPRIGALVAAGLTLVLVGI